MATITVRALDPVTGEPLYGNGQKNFVSDLDAVVQIILTRLKLFEGEWFLDLLDGLPLFQRILGASGSENNIQAILNIISARIQQSPYVLSAPSIKAVYQNRKLYYSAEITTQFGVTAVSNFPGSSFSLT